jgi:hypothetical protein
MSDLLVGNTFAGVKTASAKTIGETYSKAVQLQSSNKDVFSQMEGPEGSGRPFCVKTDLSKGGGQTVNFTTMTEAGGPGVLGEQTLTGNEDDPDFGSYNCKLEIVRHATGWTEKMRAFMAAGASLEEIYARIEGNWFGRKKQWDMMVMLRNRANYRNTLRVNGKAFDALLSTDTIGTSVITGGKALLTGLGATPADLSKKRSKAGSEILRYLLFDSNTALNSLKANSSYLAAVEQALDRGPDNVIFSGGYVDWDGNGIYEYNVQDPDTKGPIGAPILPRALLGTAIAAGTATVAITAGGRTSPSAKMRPLAWFLGYDYPFFEDQDATVDSGNYYVAILNTTGTDTGKFGVYKYTGSANDGNKISAITARLGSAASGIRVTTLAGQTWDANIHTDAHPTGSLIFQVNAKCTTIGWGYMFGAMAAVRAYGAFPDGGGSLRPIKEQGNYGMKKGMGMEAVYGQSPAQDTQNQARNYCLIPHAVNHPEAPTSLFISA